MMKSHGINSDKMPYKAHGHGVVLQTASTRGVQSTEPALRAGELVKPAGRGGVAHHRCGQGRPSPAHGVAWALLWT